MPRIAALDPATYVRHRCHQPGRIWAETNCYSDVVIEMLHGLGYEPLAAMAFTLTVDLDVDQWTFFKFRHEDLEELFALAVHELAPWKPLAVHCEENVAAGRPVLVELDSFFLPDTAGTAYKLAHVKSTVAVNDIDVAARRMGYFHNQGYYELDGQDFVDVFQVDGLVHERMLPPYIEFVKPLPGGEALRGQALVDASVGQLRRQLRRLPETNPFPRFKAKMAADEAWLLDSDLDVFHAYSFATLRQYGACYELASTYLRWLGEAGVDVGEIAIEALEEISSGTKAMQFQLARSMMRKRALRLDALDEMAARWEQGMADLLRRFG